MIKKKVLKILTLIIIGGVLNSTLYVTKANAAWKVNSTGWWYTEGNTWALGWREVDHQWYYFDSNGYMKTGWLLDKGKWYYLNNDGSMKKEWILDGGKWYYLDVSDGSMVTGDRTINAKNYKFDNHGQWLGYSALPKSNSVTKNNTDKEADLNSGSVSNDNVTTVNNSNATKTDVKTVSTTDSNKENTNTTSKANNLSSNNFNYNNGSDTSNVFGNQVADETSNEGNSINDVVNKWNTLKPTFNGNNIFDDNPVTKAPYKPGKVNKQYLNDTLNNLNFARYLANLEPVDLDSDLTEQAQYGALLTTANNVLEHTNPIHPSGMSNDIYERGKESTSSSNLCGGKVFESIQECLNDDHNLMGSDNIGHREWLLDPEVTKIGFGTTLQYSTQNLPFYDFDNSVDYPDYIAWPSQGAFPNAFIRRQAVWSINLNKDIYDMNSDVKVKVTRLCDNKEWNLNEVNDFSTDTTGFEVLSYNNYGSGRNSNTIIFHIGKNDLPVEKYLGKYKVEILGLNKDLEYTINFFNLNNMQGSNQSEINQANFLDDETNSNTENITLDDNNEDTNDSDNEDTIDSDNENISDSDSNSTENDNIITSTYNKNTNNNIEKITSKEDLRNSVLSHYKKHDTLWEFNYYGTSGKNNEEIQKIISDMWLKEKLFDDDISSYGLTYGDDNTHFQMSMSYFSN